jgi:hypothetical protein
MKKLIAFLIPCAFALSACGSEGGNPLSTLGIMSQKKEQIDYSPRPPLAIPPEEQRAQLPPPVDGVPSPLAPTATQDVAVAPPSSYATPAPPPQQAAQPAEDTPWWVRIFGS